MKRKEREELINNIIESPANQFGENEDDRACLEATPEDTLLKLVAGDGFEEKGEVSDEATITNEDPLVAPAMNFGEEKKQEEADQPLTVPAMNFSKTD